MNKQMASNPDPKVREMMQHMIDWIATPQGAATMIVLVLAALAVVFVLFSAAGGAGSILVRTAARIPLITRPCAPDHVGAARSCSGAGAFRMMRAA